ncbi:MAG: hypothetical protein IJ740_18580 [Ruminococcus sp.]|nr:hypothetical protein [Ruminococcus sp.]
MDDYKRIEKLERRLDNLEKLVMCNSHSLESAYNAISEIVERTKEQEEFEKRKAIAFEKIADRIAGIREVFKED